MMESSWRQNIIIIILRFLREILMDTSTLQVVFKFSTHHSSWRVSFEKLPFRRLLRKQMSTNLHPINNRPLGMQGACKGKWVATIKTNQKHHLVGGFSPFEKYWSNWKSSLNRGENKKYLKPPPSHLHSSPVTVFSIDLMTKHGGTSPRTASPQVSVTKWPAAAATWKNVWSKNKVGPKHYQVMICDWFVSFFWIGSHFCCCFGQSGDANDENPSARKNNTWWLQRAPPKKAPTLDPLLWLNQQRKQRDGQVLKQAAVQQGFLGQEESFNWKK